MKKKISNIFSAVTIILFSSFIFSSCDDKVYGDADYPEQIIYMPTAAHGVYDVSVVPNSDNVPTPGQPYRYIIDEASNKLIVPLGVYRAGVNNSGGFTVAIAVNNDAVAQATDASTEILPQDIYTVPTSVSMENGKALAQFNLSIDLSFLKNNPDKKYAIGVEISSTAREVNPNLSTTIILLDNQKIIE